MATFNFVTIAPWDHIARLFKINLSYFTSRARLNFRWIFKEFNLKSNMKGFFENFLALSVKKLKKVLMIPISISSRGRAFPAVSCCYMHCLAISYFYRRWTPQLENLTLADWAATWYDTCSSKPYVKEPHEVDIDGLPLRKYLRISMGGGVPFDG